LCRPDRQPHSEHIGQHRFDQIPIGLGIKQRIDVEITKLARRMAQIQFFPTQTARSIKGLDRRQVSFVNQGHITEENLNQAITRVITAYV